MRCNRMLIIGIIVIALSFQYLVSINPVDATSGSVSLSPNETKYVTIGNLEEGSLLLWSWSSGDSISAWITKPDESTISASKENGIIVSQEGTWKIAFHSNNWFFSAYVSYSYYNIWPYLNIVSPGIGSSFNYTDIQFSGTVHPYFDYVYLTTDGINYQLADKYLENWNDVIELEEGEVTVTVEADLFWGSYTTTLTKDIDLIIDLIDPLVQIEEPSAGEWINTEEIRIEWVTVEEQSGLKEYKICIDDSIIWTDVDLSTAYVIDTLSEGYHDIMVKAIDNAGNWKTSTVSFGCDRISPTISGLSPNDESRSNKDYIEITWTCTDITSGIDHYEIRIATSQDQGQWIDIGNSTTYQLNDLDDGWHTVEVKAIDKAGNEVTVRTDFDVDTGIFSIQGPYKGVPLIGLIIAIAVVALALLMLYLKRLPTKKPPEERKP